MKRSDKIAGNGYTAWPTDKEVNELSEGMTSAQMRIAMNHALAAMQAMDKMSSRLPEGSTAHSDLHKIGQDFYNLLGMVASAFDHKNGNYEMRDAIENLINEDNAA